MQTPLIAPNRLLRRITALFAAVFGIGVVGNAFDTATEQSGEMLRQLERNALAETRVIGTQITTAFADSIDALLAVRPQLPADAGLLGAALVSRDGRILSALAHNERGEWVANPSARIDPPPGELRPRVRTLNIPSATGKQALMVSWVPLTKGGQTVWLRTETDAARAQEMREHILADSLLHGLIALLIGIVALHVLLRRPLAALHACTDFAERLDHSMGDTLPVATGSHETDRLAQALNWASLNLYDQRSALAESEARTGAILGAAIDAVITFDSFGNVIEYNPAAERMLGWNCAEAMQQQPIDLLVRPDEREAHEHDLLQWLSRRFESVIGHHLELDIRHRDGRRFPAELTLTSTPLKGRTIFTAFISDISERKAAQEQMMQARDAAEAANRAKSDFLANMSHEIRTPMNAIIGMTELALDTELTDEQREYLGLVKQSSSALLTLINDILDFSKIEAGHLDLENIPFSLREAVGGIVRTLAPRPGNRVTLGCRIDPSVADGLIGDPTRLGQILTNLLSNALKFTERGSVELSITVDAHGAETQQLRFAIRDTGIGIAPDKQALIFDAFSQADTSTTRKFGGTGLGLAICRRLVQRMGGEIGVFSVPREGSTFHFTVRYPRANSGELATLAPGSLDHLPLLVIEPDEASRAHVAEQLAAWRISATLCADIDRGIGAIIAAETEARCFRALLVDAATAQRDDWILVHTLAAQCAAGLPVVLLCDDTPPPAQTLPASVCGMVARPAQASALLDALMVATGAREAANSKTPGSALHAAGRRTRLHLLLAEDNQVNQTLAVRLLERLGHQVDVAGNGLEAVAMAARKRYDLILMDLQMPQLGGFDATRHIRAQDGQRHTPIVAMTAHAMAGDREKCLEAGMDGYVSKPIQVPALLRALDDALGPRGGGENRVRATPAPEESLPRFDRNFMLGNLGGDTELMRDVIRLFLRDYAGNLGLLGHACAYGTRDELAMQAHTLKGMVRNFGATHAAGIAARLERAGEAPADDADTATLVARLERETEALAAELRHELAGDRAAA